MMFFTLFYFLFVNNVPQINIASDLTVLLEQEKEIASVFVGRFRLLENRR